MYAYMHVYIHIQAPFLKEITVWSFFLKDTLALVLVCIVTVFILLTSLRGPPSHRNLGSLLYN